MEDTAWIDEIIAETSEKLQTCDSCRLRRRSNRGEYNLPSRREIHDVLDALIGILFPGCHGHGPFTDHVEAACIQQELSSCIHKLYEQCEKGFEFKCELEDCDDCSDCPEKASRAVRGLVASLPSIQELLEKDIQAAYDGDPAAKSTIEVVMSYPAIQAITTHRVTHALHQQGVPLIPRVMSELAHSRTGIDIHPGAVIGERFFIDHGTGVVIGETAVIGRNVKIYQGVTLGAMSFPEDEDGNPIKGIKRHPNVGDNVTIYAEATVLGDIAIGEGSVIGGNVWLTHSVPPNSKVTNAQPDPEVKN